MYLYSYRVSIAAESVRCLTYILVVPSHRTFRQYQSGRRSAVWPSSLVRCSDRPYLYLLFLPWRMMSIYSNEGKRKMKTSSSKREQIDSDHRLSSSFSRTIIWRCYRRGRRRRKEREREREDENNLVANDRCPSNKNKTQERKKTTVTANHASMMYNNNRTPFFSSFVFLFPLLFFSLYLIHICSSWP